VESTGLLKYKYVKPEDVPALGGVDSDWVHPTTAASIDAAREMHGKAR